MVYTSIILFSPLCFLFLGFNAFSTKQSPKNYAVKIMLGTSFCEHRWNLLMRNQMFVSGPTSIRLSLMA